MRFAPLAQARPKMPCIYTSIYIHVYMKIPAFDSLVWGSLSNTRLASVGLAQARPNNTSSFSLTYVGKYIKVNIFG